MQIQDQDQREKALNPRKSFIVQAPAGSGKTELLTQRFLVLLSHVKQPEEILAITFTKKSSAEMRARIINALKSAYEKEPESSHAKKTWQLAKQALANNDKLKWDLLENPSRLRIQTIDSFNMSLTRQLPILSHFGATPEIADDPTLLYREATQEFLSHLEEDVAWADAIAQLLIHMDNDLNKVENLLINLLAKRDQWLPHLSNDPELRKNLEAQLACIVTDILTDLHEKFPREHVKEFLTLVNYAAHNLSDNLCCNLVNLPGTQIDDKDTWLALSNFIIKKDFDWRKKFDISVGFLPPSGAKKSDEKNRLKDLQQRMIHLVEQLSTHEDIRILFKELHQAPHPFYQEDQWQTLNALQLALRVVVAQLKVTFQQHGQIDYIENALAALTALGSEEEPTDMTLALDYRIQHILIDEFQDTSSSQFRLLEKLICGWENNDGRTLFIVGDPMQSIYRFREAEVGLFIRSRKMGIGNVHLEPLTLSVNFRSVPGVVNWVNEHFQKVLPPFEDISSGAVSYSPSVASKMDDPAQTVALHAFLKDETSNQADKIVEIIKSAREKNPQGDVAILVRSRTHLVDVIPALKKANMPYRAINIDPLTTRPVIQDLIALTKALLLPADRISWLAVLRAPWCGLSLSDLLVIAGEKPEKLIWESIQVHLSSPLSLLSSPRRRGPTPESRVNSEKELNLDVGPRLRGDDNSESGDDNSEIKHDNQLSSEGKLRLTRIFEILKTKISERRRYNLRLWVESTWIMLGGPACLDELTDLDDAQAFFRLLEKLDIGGDLNNINELENHVSDLFATPNTHTENALQIMTIHNSKGLEFDTVILPHLERKAPNDDKQLLLWMERSRQNANTSLILAPVHAIGEENDSIYEYIKRQNSIKTDYENGRLLYVAVTRAKKELHLLFDLDSNERGPITKSLLEKIWGTIQKDISKKINTPSEILDNKVVEFSERKIKRLTLNWQQPLQEKDSANHPAYLQNNSEFDLPDNTPQFTGILIHQILQQICLQKAAWWHSQTDAAKNSHVKNQLLQLGVLSEHITKATTHVMKAINNTLNDPRGQWILNSYSKSDTELCVTSVINDAVNSLVIDRTFVDETGVRWIIDYKTSVLMDSDLEDFLNAEQKKHQQQLWEYHQAMQAMDDKPIRVGLYFPLIPAWREWSF